MNPTNATDAIKAAEVMSATNSSSGTRAGRRRRGLIAGGAAAGLVLVVGAWLLLRGDQPAGAHVAAGDSARSGTPAAGGETRDSLALSPAALKSNPIQTVAVRRVRLATDLDVVGSATFDADRYAIVGPLVHGRVVTLLAGPGDQVTRGQVLAEIESAEVGQAEASYLAAVARNTMSQANLRRERDLAERKISSGREREMAEAQAAADHAELRAAEQRLRAFGLTPSEVAAVPGPGRRAGRVALRSPIHGVIIQRKIAIGQAVEAATDCFRVADLDRLWVHLDLFEKDLALVHVGQEAKLRTEAWPGEIFPSRVAYVEPVIDDATRTARVRIAFVNKGRKLRPGQFVTAHIHGDTTAQAPEVMAVPRKAVVTAEGKSLVFVAAGGGYTRRIVEIGRSGGDLVEIRSGLAAGEQVVSDGAFLLKSELLR